MHGGYAEETALSSNINVTDKDESKEIIVHEPLSENLSMDVSESECNIVHKTLSQNNSSDIPANVIRELKDDENIESSVNDKGSSCFNIFECVRNLLDQLDVTYQRVFTASLVGYVETCTVGIYYIISLMLRSCSSSYSDFI